MDVNTQKFIYLAREFVERNGFDVVRVIGAGDTTKYGVVFDGQYRFTVVIAVKVHTKEKCDNTYVYGIVFDEYGDVVRFVESQGSVGVSDFSQLIYRTWAERAFR